MVENERVMEGRAGSGWALLRTRDFGLLFSGQVISQIGDSMNKVALLWFVYELTGSAFKMAIIGLLQTIPPLVFGPLIGVYLDRMKKKPVMVWVDPSPPLSQNGPLVNREVSIELFLITTLCVRGPLFKEMPPADADKELKLSNV